VPKTEITEHQICTAIWDHYILRGANDVVMLHIPNEGKRSGFTGKRLKDIGLVPGCPDYLIVRSGMAYFLEVKTERGRLSFNQRFMIEELTAVEADVFVGFGLDECLQWLEEIGVLD